ncbi:unnamed protein product [Phytophthora lilii]|uniref:Unnamed protein product n=1 Tax=Phytophthora lilii TaxID=2077276 RepID=A0A9W6TKE3_9STRA|nr:unnamed protein product [Phytophthora lilii]
MFLPLHIVLNRNVSWSIFILTSMRRRSKDHRTAVHAVPPVATSNFVHKPESNTTPSLQYALSIEDIVVMLVLATGTLLGYTLTLYPSVAGGDSGELVAESCHLGVSHPPGYPLFNMVALFGFSPLIWTYAVGAEVFALNNAFAAGLVYLFLRYMRLQDLKSALAGAFVCGLAMCNQHTIALFELPIIVLVLWTRRQTLWWKEFAQLTGTFALGLMPYIYMPITAIWNSQPGSWGDVTTLGGLVHHIRRADYGTFRLFASNEANEDLWTRLHLYGVDLATREIPLHLAFPVVSIGMLQTLRASTGMNRQVGWFIIAMYTFYMVVFHSLANLPISEGLIYGVQMRFWQQPNVVVFLWLGIGLGYLVNLMVEVAGGNSILRSIVFSALCQCGCLTLIGVQIWRWHELCDQSQGFYIRNYAQALLDPLPPNAVLFVNFDLQWTSLRYLQRCERRRPDVTVLNLSMMTYKWFSTKHGHYRNIEFPGSRLIPFGSVGDGFSMAKLLDHNIGYAASKQQPRFFLGGKLSYNDQDFNERFTLVPFGLLDEFQSLSTPSPSLKKWYSSQQKIRRIVRERLPILPPEEIYNDETWEWTIRTIAEDPENLSLLSEAAKPMELSYQFEPLQFWNPASNLKNLGLAYAQMVKSSQEFIASTDPFLNDAVGSSVEDHARFKDRASARMLEVWDAWLQVPEAKQDPGYEAIKGVVCKFVPSTSDENAVKGKKSRQSQRRRKKRNAKKKSTTRKTARK